MTQSKESKEILLIANRSTKAQLEQLGSPLLLDPAVGLLIVPDENDTPLARALDSQRLLIPGAMLIRSPYDRSKYSLADKADENFLREKHFITSLIAGLVGARTVSIQQVEVIEGEKVRTIELNGKYQGISGVLNAKDDDINQFVSSLHLIDEYEENKPRVEEARREAESCGLLSDQNIASLVKAAEFGLVRRRRQVLLTVANDARHAFSVAAGLNIPANLNIGVNYQSFLRRKREYRLLINIDF